ncbi:MAG: S-methyl-5-thioribose-1-phosphate isomerase [Myxococcaceae bacterium]
MKTLELAAPLTPFRVLDQTRLPSETAFVDVAGAADGREVIASMVVRGAPLIGVVAGFALALELARDASDGSLAAAANKLTSARPTAVNLAFAVEQVAAEARRNPPKLRAEAAWKKAQALNDLEVDASQKMGEAGLELIKQLNVTGTVQLMTHCNAGWLATVGLGTALAPIYLAHQAGIPVHVWVSETRPRNQGLLTEFELRARGVPHTFVADNACGLLLQRGRVNAVIVGTDRTTANGDVCNKVGTYLKALAAKEAKVPFWVAAPSSSIDFSLKDGAQIEIEERSGAEVRKIGSARIVSDEVNVANPAFDVTPAKFVSALITERGACEASRDGLKKLFPEKYP